ncbi:MAG: hypothetical protein D6710_00405 [Nitrospirae bacterium]|nr:MAG: hypothetical protein D6710_00405 [Nitrospirota bacterium]
MKKEKRLVDIICKRFCVFYKPGKEELLCGTYLYLLKHYDTTTLELVPADYRADFTMDEEIMKQVCKGCDFLKDGCGYRDGEGTPPCGGYTIVEWLLKKH